MIALDKLEMRTKYKDHTEYRNPQKWEQEVLLIMGEQLVKINNYVLKRVIFKRDTTLNSLINC